MSSREFKIYSPRGLYAPPGIYVVTAKLPERDSEFEYHIKHSSELHERIAKEGELREGRRWELLTVLRMRRCPLFITAVQSRPAARGRIEPDHQWPSWTPRRCTSSRRSSAGAAIAYTSVFF